jgi:hypothetical protein
MFLVLIIQIQGKIVENGLYELLKNDKVNEKINNKKVKKK